jgi:hypothetical protein
MSISAVVQVKLRTCEEHENTIVVFAGDFCPMCAALEDLAEAKEDLEEFLKKGDLEAIERDKQEEEQSCTS